jgi:glycerol uptake facilitator-like aquaporin
MCGGSAVGRVAPSLAGRPAIVGLITGILLIALIVSPLGLSSGGHFNPAVTVTLWIRRGEPAALDGAGYLVAQLIGSIAGVLLGRVLLGAIVATPGVNYAAISPQSWSGGAVFFGGARWFVALMIPVLLFMEPTPFGPVDTAGRRPLRSRVARTRSWIVSAPRNRIARRSTTMAALWLDPAGVPD